MQSGMYVLQKAAKYVWLLTDWELVDFFKGENALSVHINYILNMYIEWTCAEESN